MITFVCYKWKPKTNPRGWRTYKPEYVHALYRMIEDNYDKPFRFVCITDDPTGLEVETLPIADMVDLPSPHGDLYPSCYKRLWLFSEEASEVLPGQVVCIDIDCVIAGNITHLFDRDDDCVMWHDPSGPRFKYSGGLWMIRTGTRTHVWDDFDPVESPKLASHYVGSDQAWMSYCLDGEAYWDRSDGIYRNRDLKAGDQALILMTPNQYKPWTDSFKIKHKRYYDIWHEAAYGKRDEI